MIDHSPVCLRENEPLPPARFGFKPKATIFNTRVLNKIKHSEDAQCNTTLFPPKVFASQTHFAYVTRITKV